MGRRYVVVLTEAQLLHAQNAVGYAIEFGEEGDWLATGQQMAVRERTAEALREAIPVTAKIAKVLR